MPSRPRRPSLRRLAVPAAAAGVAAVGYRQRSRRRTAWPAEGGITPEQSLDHTRELYEKPRITRRDLAMDFAAGQALTVEPLLHGHRYFPRMLDDIKAAKDHVHLLIYGYKEGEIGRTFLAALGEKVKEGVEVRLIVDAIGSEIDLKSKQLYRDLREAGVTIVANEGMASFRTGPLGSRRATLHWGDFLHFDHRKMLVVDGQIGYVGGSGIEDSYTTPRFYDVMCRLTGPIVSQLALVFLSTWRYLHGPIPDSDLARYFPTDVSAPIPDDANAIKATILWNVPGTGHHPISDAIEQSIAASSNRIDIVNPYISNKAILRGLLAAAQRGVQVRLIAPGEPTPPYPAAAFRHAYRGLLEAGATIVLHPQMAHAKVLRIDDRVLIGGCNLDDLSLFRNNELDILFEHPTMPGIVEAAVFEELVGMSTPAEPSTGRRTKAWEAAMARASRFL